MNIPVYICAHVTWAKELPLVFFCEQDLSVGLKYLRDHHIPYDEGNIVHDTEIEVNCKHFPYTCSEVEHEHDVYSTGTCSCHRNYTHPTKACYCNTLTHEWRSYIQFDIDDQYMQYCGSCSEGDCHCRYVSIHDRYKVSLVC